MPRLRPISIGSMSIEMILALGLTLYGPNFPPAVEQSGPQRFAAMLKNMGVPAPSLAAYASGLAEFGGGIAYLLGFRTRLASLAVMFNMATAIRKVHWDKGLYGEGGFEFPLLLDAIAAALFFTGPGALSLDAATSVVRHGDRDDDDD